MATTFTLVTSLRQAALAAGVVAMGCAGCGSDTSAPRAGTLALIRLTPATVTLVPGGTQPFVASCVDGAAAPIACPDISWAVTGGTRASTSATTDTAGLFTAGATEGVFTITVTDGKRSQVAAVTIQASASATPNVVVDSTTTFQTWDAWEHSSTTVGDPPYSYSDALADSVVHFAVNEMGQNRIRLEAAWNNIETDGTPSGNPDSPYIWKNDNADPNLLNPAGFRWGPFDTTVHKWVLPLKKYAGSAFRLNLNVVAMRVTPTSVRADSAEYAEFGLAVLQHLKTVFNLTPDYFELMLEPRVTGTELGRDLAALRARIGPAGFGAVKIIGPSLVNPNPTVSYTQALRAVPGAGTPDEISYHRYTTPAAGSLAGIAQLASGLGVHTSMLEHIGANEHELYDDLTQANVSAWQRYILAGPPYNPPKPKEGRYLWVTPASGTIVVEPSAFGLRQYMKYIHHGAVRLAATATSGAIQPVAFRDPNGGFVVIANTTGLATLKVGGLPGGSYLVTYSTASHPGAVGAVQTIGAGATFTTTIPAAGVVTISPAP
jgi:hypothetical protein